MQQIVQGQEDAENAWMDSKDKDTKGSGQYWQTNFNSANTACPLSAETIDKSFVCNVQINLSSKTQTTMYLKWNKT